MKKTAGLPGLSFNERLHLNKQYTNLELMFTRLNFYELIRLQMFDKRNSLKTTTIFVGGKEEGEEEKK